MMRKLLFLGMGLFCSMMVLGQTNFQKLTINEAAAKAKAEGKMIFVDLYTSWCVPCKMMADHIFPDLALGQFMNERFVCVKYDAEQEGDGKALAEKFAVQSYPTFLILNTEQELENQIVGGVEKPDEFRVKVEVALNASMATLSRRFEEGEREVVFLRDYLRELLRSYMLDQAKVVCDAFLTSVPDKEKTDWDSWFVFEDDALTSWGTPSFDYLLSHFEQFGNTVGKEEALEKISRTFETQLVYMLWGRASMDNLDKLAEQMAPFRFNAKQRLDMYMAMCTPLSRLRKKQGTDKDREDLLSLCEKVYPMTPGDKLRMFYFQVLGAMGNTTKEQDERIERLHELTLKYSDCNAVTSVLRNMKINQQNKQGK